MIYFFCCIQHGWPITQLTAIELNWGKFLAQRTSLYSFNSASCSMDIITLGSVSEIFSMGKSASASSSHRTDSMPTISDRIWGTTGRTIPCKRALPDLFRIAISWLPETSSPVGKVTLMSSRDTLLVDWGRFTLGFLTGTGILGRLLGEQPS